MASPCCDCCWLNDWCYYLGKMIGSILRGLLGAIVSFAFRTAGQVISFLGKNAWLLILFVAAFLIEMFLKKRRD